MSVIYYPVKANVVADDFSGVSMGSLTNVVDDRKDLVNEVISGSFGCPTRRLSKRWFHRSP